MPRILNSLMFAFLVVVCQVSAKAQDTVVPAGTLFHCTLQEPNFSSKTAKVGDPVICHLNSVGEFGHVVIPRGSYLAGHLEASGKGYLKLEFDRILLEDSEIPVLCRVVGARGFRVDRNGEILGNDYDRPVLKGEQQLTLRLMDNIEVPAARSTGSSKKSPYAYQPKSSDTDRP